MMMLLGLAASLASRPTDAGSQTTSPKMRTGSQGTQVDYVNRVYDVAVNKLMSQGYAALSDTERTVYLVCVLDAQVDNGGFDQYFFNSSGDQAADAPAALDRIGALGASAIARRALAVFPGSAPSRDRRVRQKQRDALSADAQAKLHGLDREWYRNTEDLDALLAQYLQRRGVKTR